MTQLIKDYYYTYIDFIQIRKNGIRHGGEIIFSYKNQKEASVCRIMDFLVC